MSCDHEFITPGCSTCEAELTELRAVDEAVEATYGQRALIQKQKLDLAQLRDAFDDAVALLRDWEDYDPADPEAGWKKRRDEFLAEHEGAGR